MWAADIFKIQSQFLNKLILGDSRQLSKHVNFHLYKHPAKSCSLLGEIIQQEPTEHFQNAMPEMISNSEV